MPSQRSPKAGAEGPGAAGAALAVLLAVGAAYANALVAGFQFDDWDVIVRDPRVQGIAAWWQAMPGMRPLLKLGYALNHAASAGPAGFHAVNVVLHAGNGLLVLWLARALFGRCGYPPVAVRWLALGTALVFVLHPVQTEAVTYASGRSVSQATLFALAAIATWVAGRDRGSAFLVHAVSPACLVLAVASRETAVVLPLALWLWAAADPTRPFRPGEVLRATAVHGAVLVAAGAVLLTLPAYRDLLAASLATRGPLANLLAQADGIAWLAGQIIRLDRLNADPALPVGAGIDAGRVATLAALAGAAALALAGLRRRPLPAFAVLWFLLWLAPTNSLLARLDLANDRQLYAALLGPALLVAAAAYRLAGGRGAVAALGLAPLVVALGVATHLRNEVYRDEVTFWQDVAAKAPHNARAFNNLGVALASRCDLAGAGGAWARALALEPGYVRAAVNLRLLRAGLLPAGVGPCGPAPVAGAPLPGEARR